MFATGGHELGKLANNSPRPCQLDRLDSWLDAGDFEEAVLKAVNLGDDADATGAVCGQLAGAFWGGGIGSNIRVELPVHRRHPNPLLGTLDPSCP